MERYLCRAELSERCRSHWSIYEFHGRFVWTQCRSLPLDGVPPTGVATLKVRKGDINLALWKGLEHLESEATLSPPRGPPLKNSMKMTTKILTINSQNFQFLLSWNFSPTKNSVLDNFPEMFPLPNPLHNAYFINIVVSASLTMVPLFKICLPEFSAASGAVEGQHSSGGFWGVEVTPLKSRNHA